MTITLAAVYTPVGIQGGLTGALFREFAFTLAGAVIVSGVVALTLSPMMGAKLLRAGDSDRGYAGWVNRRFEERAQRVQPRAGGNAALSPRRADAVGDCGPADGAVLHVLAAGTGANGGPGILLRHRSGVGEFHARSDEAVYEVYLRRLSLAARKRQHLSDHLSYGRVWRHDDQAVERAHQDHRAARDGDDGPAVADSGHSRHPDRAAAAAGRRRFPRRLRHRVGCRAAAAERDRQPARAESVRERVVHLRRCRSQVRSAPGRSRVRSRQSAVAGRRFEPGGSGPVDAAWRRLREPLQQSGAQLQGDSADQARRAALARTADRHLRYRLGRSARAALDLRHARNHHTTARAEEIPAAQRGPHTRCDPASCSARSGAALPRG